MMKTLHIFNPSHDEALAAHSPYYTPSRAARRMEAELWDLPRLWAAEGDAVWDFRSAVRWDELARIEPWGWDALLRHRLERAGAPVRLLPTAEELASVRRLSSRQTAVSLLPLLRGDCSQTLGASAFCASEQALHKALQATHNEGYMLKAPWSSSGRGVFRLQAADNARAVARAQRILRRQGGIVVEPYQPHVADFAMEFRYERGVAYYEGLSLFQASPSGAYLGNVVDADEGLMRRLCALAPAFKNLPDVLHDVRASLLRRLPELLRNDYEGPLGVDMMLSHNAIHPCVEVNLRRTMGSVAIALRTMHSLPARFFLAEEDGKLRPMLRPITE